MRERGRRRRLPKVRLQAPTAAQGRGVQHRPGTESAAHAPTCPLPRTSNNAGIQFVSPVEQFPEDKWDDVIAVCLSSAFHATKAAVPHMLEAGWGRIINTGSMHALVVRPGAQRATAGGVARRCVQRAAALPGLAACRRLGDQRAPLTLLRRRPGFPLQERVQRGQARHRRLHQDGGPGAGAQEHHLQRNLPRIRAHGCARVPGSAPWCPAMPFASLARLLRCSRLQGAPAASLGYAFCLCGGHTECQSLRSAWPRCCAAAVQTW